MADNIYLRAGAKAGMPKLANREIAYCTDEEAIYIGTPNGNVKLGDTSALEAKIASLEGAVNSLADRVSALEGAEG